MHASRPGAPPHAGLPSRRTAGDQDHRADPKVTRIMSASTLEQPAAAHVDELVARMRGRLLDPLAIAVLAAVISGAWASRPSLWFDEGQRSRLQPAGHCQSYGVCWAISTPCTACTTC